MVGSGSTKIPVVYGWDGVVSLCIQDRSIVVPAPMDPECNAHDSVATGQDRE